MDFKDIYILTDMDGTLIGSNHAVSQKNKDAINRFVEAGGTFGVATGRACLGIFGFIENVNINGYCVVSNGAVIYEPNQREIIHEGFLNREKLLPFMQKVVEEYPEICVQMYTCDSLYMASNASGEDEYIKREKMDHEVVDMYDCECVKWNKVLFHTDDKNIILEIEKMAEKELAGQFEMNFSSEFYFEILPSGYTKGDSLERIRNMQQFAGKKFLALGDHMNDVKMLEMADFSICPTNAKDGAKAVCTLKADVSNDEDLIAWAIEKLENGEIDFKGESLITANAKNKNIREKV